MVAEYTSSVLGDINKTLTFDYSDSHMKEWQTMQPAMEYVKARPFIGLAEPIGKDVNYFASEFGNARNSIAFCSPRDVGMAFSKAYEVKRTIGDFMENTFNPNISHADPSIYLAYKDFLKDAGHDKKFNISYVASGIIPDSAIAAILPLPKDHAAFFKQRDYSDIIQHQAKYFNVSYKASALYTMMHEFTHLHGVDGDANGEARLELLIETFSSEMAKRYQDAGGKVSDARKAELASLMKEIAKIAKARRKLVNELYGSNSWFFGQNHNSGSRLESTISSLYKEAAARDMTPEGAEKYVMRKLEEMGYKKKENNYNKSPEYKSSEKKKKEKKKKEQKKKSEKKKKAKS